jgi:hypothetical protein
MAHVNIGSSNAGDEFYRYKMPALQSKARAARRGRRRPKPQGADGFATGVRRSKGAATASRRT